MSKDKNTEESLETENTKEVETPVKEEAPETGDFLERMEEEEKDILSFLYKTAERLERLDTFLKKETKEVYEDEKKGKVDFNRISLLTQLSTQYDIMNTAVAAASSYKNLVTVRVQYEKSRREALKKMEEDQKKKEEASEESKEQTTKEEK